MAHLKLSDRDRGEWKYYADEDEDATKDEGRRIALVGAGLPPPEERLRTVINQATAVVCAGNGLRAAWSAGILPDLVVGDLRGLPAWASERLPAKSLIDDRQQESNDLEKALRETFRRWGASAEVSILAGSEGTGRSDHTLANLGSLLAEPHRRLQWVDAEGRTVALRAGRLDVDDLVGTTLSILPWSLHGSIVSTVGVHYPLDEERLYLGGRGLSNQVGDDIATIEVHEGVSLIWVGV